jgi:hypothetical protein
VTRLSPAWYPDERDPNFLRWWDGSRWTEHTHPIAGPPPTGPPKGAPGVRQLGARAWMRSHKALSAVVGVCVAVLLLGTCGALLPDPDEPASSARPDDPPASESDEPTVPTTEPESAPEPAPEPEPTQREIWLANYDENEADYLLAVAAALAVQKAPRGADQSAIATCLDAAKERQLAKRVLRFGEAWKVKRPPTFNQAVAVVGATVDLVCPDVAGLHTTQVAERAAKIEKARIEAARKRREAARQEAREERRREREEQRQEEEERRQQEAENSTPVYYENCDAVRAAGAAPIYAGEPGYSRDLDRDGDGVGCET